MLCLSLVACGSTPNQTLLSQQTTASYTMKNPQALPKALRIPLTEKNGYLFVEGSINGKRAGAMMLDTGSSLNIIDTGVVNRFGLEKVGEGQTRGIAGTQAFGRHRVESLAIGELDLGVDEAGALSMYAMTRGLRTSVTGLIGSVSLLPQPFAIDYVKRELVVYNRKTFVPPVDAQGVTLEFYGRLPAVRAKLANGKEVLLIIDTGMDSAVALPNELTSWQGIFATSASSSGQSRGVGGEIQTQVGWLKSLEVFGYTLGGVPVTFEPEVHESRRQDLPVGRIGSELLKGFRLTFDARYRAMWAEFSAPVAGE